MAKIPRCGIQKSPSRACTGRGPDSPKSRSSILAVLERIKVIALEAPSAGPVSGVTDTVGDTLGGVSGMVGGATDCVRGVTDNLLGGGGEKQR